MINRPTSFWLIFLGFLAQSCNATLTIPEETQKLIARSEFIGQVKITRGEILALEQDGQTLDCGYKFTAEVMDALKGDASSKEFISEGTLEIGHDYLIYLTAGDSDGSTIISTNSNMADDLGRARSERALCESKFAFSKSISSETSEFTSGQYVVDDAGEPKTEHWIEYSSSIGAYHSDEIDILSFVPTTIEIVNRHSKEKVVTDYFEFLDKSLYMPGMKYPHVVLDEVLMKWSDVRTVLVRLISENESSEQPHP